MTILSVNNLNVHYGKTHALQDIDFQVMENEFVGIIGPNGGGKTTLMRTILGFIEPTSGSVNINKDISYGYVPQHTLFDTQFPITVKETILMGYTPKRLKLLSSYSKSQREIVDKLMKQLHVSELANRQIGKLSGGQLQKVLIARSIISKPNILMLDEPTSGIDNESKKEIYNMLSSLTKHMTVLMVSHDTEAILKYLDKIIYINKTAHIHNTVDKTNTRPKDDDCCPIDWFFQGLAIHKYQLSKKGKNND